MDTSNILKVSKLFDKICTKLSKNKSRYSMELREEAIEQIEVLNKFPWSKDNFIAGKVLVSLKALEAKLK